MELDHLELSPEDIESRLNQANRVMKSNLAGIPDYLCNIVASSHTLVCILFLHLASRPLWFSYSADSYSSRTVLTFKKIKL